MVQDPARLVAVRRTTLLDGPPNATFDRLTELARFLLDAPIALCSLLDAERYFFISCAGMPEPYRTTREVPISAGFCKHTLVTRMPLVLEDADADPQFSGYPVVAEMGIRGYIGVPLITSDGQALGTFCAMDLKSRKWNAEQVRAVETLAAAAVSEIERSAALSAAREAHAELERRHNVAEALVETAATLARSRNIEEACQSIVENLRVLLHGDAALLCGVEGLTLRAIAVAGATGSTLRPGILFPEGYGPPSIARQRACVITTLDVLNDPDIPLTPDLREAIAAAPFRAVMSVPLALDDVLLGTLCVMDRPGRVFTLEDQRLAQGFAHQAALALQNARLLQQAEQRRHEAEESNRAKDEFLAMLAHELRNPLAAVVSAVDVMRRRAADATVLTAVDVAERQLSHQVRLLDDLLDVARVTNGTISLRRTRFPLEAAVAEAVQSVQQRMERHRQALTVGIPDGVHVEADRTRLVQVMANLLANATKYTPGGGRIALTGEVEGGSVVLRVRDDGIGIEPAILPRVFDPFVQQVQPLARTAGGLGIGLTLVRRIVELHGGSVEGRSDGPGHGSEFIVRLPIVVDPAEGRGGARSPAAVSIPATRILVVEDNADAGTMLQTALELAGHEVHLADAGDTGLAAALALRPRVVLIDIGLPRVDGYELARRLRAEMGSEVLLCALTGYGQASDRQNGKAVGFDHYLVKPIDLESLQQIIASSVTGGSVVPS